jgi:hypothetical protein
LRQDLFVAQRNRIGDHEAGEVCGLEPLDGRPAQHRVRRGDVDFLDAVLVQRFGGAGDGAGRADHVVEHHRDFALDLAAQDMGLDGGFGAGAALVDDGHAAADALGMAQSPLDAALVGADDHRVGQIDIGVQEVLVKHRRRA